MLTKGRESSRALGRALILRQLDHGQKAALVAASVGVAAKTVRAIGRRYEEEHPRKGFVFMPSSA